MIAEGIYGLAQEALSELNVDLEEVLEKEVDPGLGNGGFRSFSRLLVHGFYRNAWFYQARVTAVVMNMVCSAKKLKTVQQKYERPDKRIGLKKGHLKVYSPI